MQIPSEEWKRDGLLIVCFGSVHCDVWETLRVFLNLALHARFVSSAH